MGESSDIKMAENKPNILEQSLVALPKFEFKRFKDSSPQFSQALDYFDETTKQIIEQGIMIKRELDERHLSIDYALKTAIELKKEIEKNDRFQLKFLFNYFKDFFGFERAKEITKWLYNKLENIAKEEDTKTSKKEISRHYHQMRSYLSDVFAGR